MNKKSKWIKVDEEDWLELKRIAREFTIDKGGTWYFNQTVKELIKEHYGLEPEEEG